MGFFDYSGLIGRGVGTVIGAWFGGPAGASLGGMAGQMEGDKIGAVGKGEQDWSTLLSPGPAQPQAESPYAHSLAPIATQSLNESYGVGGFGRGMSFQNGGIVPGDPGEPVPILAHGGETILPASTNMAEFSILKNAPNYSDPTSGVPAASTTAAQPTGEGFDWGKALTGVGRVLSGTAAGLQGDNSYGLRLQAVMDKTANRKRQTGLAERQQMLDTFKVMPQIHDYLDFLNDTMSPESRTAENAQRIADSLNKSLGSPFFNQDQIMHFMGEGGGDALDNFKAQFSIAKRLSEEPQGEKVVRDLMRQYNKPGGAASVNKKMSDYAQAAAFKFVENGKEVPGDVSNAMMADDRTSFRAAAGDIVAKKVQEDINANNLNKDISRADFMKKYPNSNLLSDANFSVLVDQGYKNLKSTGQMQAEQRATAGTQRDTQTVISTARMLTGKNVDSTKDLTQSERDDVEAYLGATAAEKTQLNILRQQNPGKTITELLPLAARTADERKVSVQVNIAGGSAQAAAQGRERGYQATINERLDRMSREQTAQAQGRPLEQADRSAISTMEQTLKIAGQIKDEFTPEEINKYIGQYKRPIAQVKELVRADPQFERLNTLIMQIKGTAFAEGGKQLTPFEAGITFGHIPTGDEFNASQFLTKLNTTVEQTAAQIERRYEKANQARGARRPGAAPGTQPNQPKRTLPPGVTVERLP